ncbi:hypothetical protein [Cupriavidus sp. TMH.W2]|uniref:hypothetical protein n=1 Tax=Cupriavidus sp. TMH.W2 TaxID=3434465 RepID=UPI003D78A857
MMTDVDNLFYVFAKELVASPFQETYLLISTQFVAPPLQSHETARVLGVALPVADAATAIEALARHYQHCRAAELTHTRFLDGCGGVLKLGSEVVQFTVRRIAERPEAYRVFFTRYDAYALAVNMQAQLTALSERVARLEAAREVSRRAA